MFEKKVPVGRLKRTRSVRKPRSASQRSGFREMICIVVYSLAMENIRTQKFKTLGNDE